MPHGVVKQGVDRQAEPLLVGPQRHRVQPAELPAAARRGAPPADDVSRELFEGNGLGLQELRIGDRGDDEQVLRDPAQPVQLADHDADVLKLLAPARLPRDPARQGGAGAHISAGLGCPPGRCRSLGQAVGQQLRMAQGDRDRGPQLVRRVLHELPLNAQHARVRLADDVVLVLGRLLAVHVPHHAPEHRRHQRDLGQLLRRLGTPVDVKADAGARRHHDDGQHPHGRPGGPVTKSVEQREADPDEVERDRLPVFEPEDRDQVEHREDRPRQVDARQPGRAPGRRPGGQAGRDPLREASSRPAGRVPGILGWH